MKASGKDLERVLDLISMLLEPRELESLQPVKRAGFAVPDHAVRSEGYNGFGEEVSV